MTELLAVGRVSRAHGIRGEVSILPLSEIQARFEPGSVLRLEDGRRLTVEAARSHQRRVLVKFREVPDRSEAEALRGMVLLVGAEEVPAPPQGAYWVHQVVGLEVVTEEGRSLGRVSDVLSGPANDVWATDDGALIPAVREVVLEVDLEGGRVVVRPPEGLLDVE